MDYTPHTEDDLQAMLAEVGVARVADLFAHLPEDVRLGRALDIPPGLSEPDLRARVGALASRNRAEVLSFVGAGAYAHYVPSAVDALASRSEFATAYTPYQPEVSQGTLQAIFEFQTITSILLGTDVANASMYDGASAAAEAVLMALRLKSGRGRDARPSRVLVARSLHPGVRDTIATYLRSMDDVSLAELGFDGAGRVRLDDVADDAAGAQSDIACVVVGYPNFFGVVEQLPEIAAWARARGALLVTVTLEPLALGLLTPPGALGADIAVGEGQGLGLAPAFGGPGVGLFGTREGFLRAMPGRVVGETVDADGKRAFCLTLSTREQHIRRDKATSNICTNHSLCALAFTVCVSLLGPGGLRDLARLNARKLRYAVQHLASSGLSERFTGPSFNECVLRGADVGGRWERLVRRGIVAGMPLGRWYPELEDSLLLCVTDVHRRGDVERLASEWRTAGAA
ncbi:MAG: aminomethyl-transferring glycine dehydrogenase subunit GcvPA [Deltaproteobacteria bacterium]|nr:aminomethyl-transferring glycine dehydrogenase subunit GcvPA [Deltaproteobacteria bacterium]